MFDDYQNLPDLTHKQLLSPAQMQQADNLTMANGVSGFQLMQNAGTAAADLIIKKFNKQATLVFCGPGNNGGDGFIIAQALMQAGWQVGVALLGDLDSLHGDAAKAAKQFSGHVLNALSVDISAKYLIIDAIFGAGLNRDISGDLLELIKNINNSANQVCAIDIPTGIDGANGQIRGAAIRADITISFFTLKPGHFLLPGRKYCGDVFCLDIGIKPAVFHTILPNIYANSPELWLNLINVPDLSDHKYKRGHALIIGGAMPGASRLAALASARIGAGLVTLAVPEHIWSLQAGALTSVMVETVSADLSVNLADHRRNAILIGPGLGNYPAAKDHVLAVLASKRPCVLDADALSLFQDDVATLFQALHADCVLTPHAGEFARLFDFTGDKLADISAAVATTGATVLLKGADTVIAAVDGRIAINYNAPPYLATAGSGDVLAGCIVGLLATGMPAFESACAAVWLHGAAATSLGYGLLAEDLPAELPQQLFYLLKMAASA